MVDETDRLEQDYLNALDTDSEDVLLIWDEWCEAIKHGN
jgi:hypothetical protein